VEFHLKFQGVAPARHVEQAREIAKKYSTDPKAPMKLSSRWKWN
jgi:hypothetical protein